MVLYVPVLVPVLFLLFRNVSSGYPVAIIRYRSGTFAVKLLSNTGGTCTGSGLNFVDTGLNIAVVVKFLTRPPMLV
jgi:uncharacterized membrane protein